MSLVYRGLTTLHYMGLPSAGRRLKENFSGVIAFDSSIDVVANTVFGSHETKKLIRTLVSCSNGNKQQIKTHFLRNKVINNRGSWKQIVIEKALVLVNIDFS